ncbi:hypothetical protein THASP1DRAFT_29478 [Thamnocephalis sphaerospora]|uniref:G-patch domain-containing protein n=1 Tax=Thamnocephalis sphaerospora TaxID=78915 RepID=A0A4P9XRK1_9FUNG|nr:hypothetical protein THASP1DRAFT_29478 [Thamnocephalis sphaerospora]|eukprot:RKP08716.1 hypothetical protein THASP1DRAFT_29478 [Thamnocephalis sphaerospora]
MQHALGQRAKRSAEALEHTELQANETGDMTQHLGVGNGANSDNDDDDYLSMDLAALEQQTSTKKRMTYSEKRRRTLKEQERRQTAPHKEIEQQQRDKGLSAALDAQNKGFRMLQKLGYVQGQALGRAGDGVREPINVTIRSTREGLGVAEERARAIETQVRAAAEKAQETEDGFAARMSDAFERRRMEADSKVSSGDNRIALQGISEHPLWLAPIDPLANADLLALEAAQTAKEADDEANIATETKDTDEAIDEDTERIRAEREIYELLEPHEQLERITQYLREQHHYCLWCGERYADASELELQCPGPTAEDH